MLHRQILENDVFTAAIMFLYIILQSSIFLPIEYPEILGASHVLKEYYAHLNTFVQSYNIASEALNNFKKIHYMY